MPAALQRLRAARPFRKGGGGAARRFRCRRRSESPGTATGNAIPGGPPGTSGEERPQGRTRRPPPRRPRCGARERCQCARAIVRPSLTARRGGGPPAVAALHQDLAAFRLDVLDSETHGSEKAQRRRCRDHPIQSAYPNVRDPPATPKVPVRNPVSTADSLNRQVPTATARHRLAGCDGKRTSAPPSPIS
jgi:hypothetical protein